LPDVELFKRLVEQTCFGKTTAKAIAVDPESLEGASPATLPLRLKDEPLRGVRAGFFCPKCQPPPDA